MVLKETKHFKIININDEHHWHQERSKGIGGSDAGIICNLSPYKTPYELWEEKTGLKKAKFVTNDAIELGNALEPILFELFKATKKEYEVIDTKDISLVSKAYPFMRANLDGALIDENRRYGILEIKTTTIQNMTMYGKWKDGVPDTYYAQVLHYLNTTGFKFVVLFAWIKLPFWNKEELRTYYFDAEDEQVKSDMAYVLEQEKEFWNKVETRTPPAFISRKIII